VKKQDRAAKTAVIGIGTYAGILAVEHDLFLPVAIAAGALGHDRETNANQVGRQV
jgi:hypothetical protein